ncbi:FAD-binding oxidoreductase [Caulobacter sp. D5]|uniref:FAD-binding oxidoreductase n=2 Tax=unclassified Caulobacter TaxID=2648921 RepID=UPI000D725E1B|nr:FAD-binding oxidoreductase [Caulobacter sp. D5]PXA84695.1 FAD-binding oxidoreductase [Caulobacter sp. D5]
MQTKRYFASRRDFLAAGGLLAMGAALAPRSALARSPLHAPNPTPPAGPAEGEWDRLARNLSGGVLRAWDADYQAIALPNNLEFAGNLPQGVARCGSAADVAFAIGWARQNDVPLIVRGGGHSYAGYSTTTGLMLDTGGLSQASYDAATGVARAGAGARNRDLYRLLRSQDRAVTHGRCPSVGAAGFLLGGGIGFNMRAHGLGCDQLVESEIVLADGSLRRLSPKAADPKDRDLFWASQGGGGGNFGVSTSFSLQTFDVKGKVVTVFDLSWSRTPDAPHPKVSVAELGAKLMAVLDDAPNALGSRVSFGAVTPVQVKAGYDVPISLLGQFVGPRDALMKLLQPVFDLAKPTGGAGVEELLYWPAQDFLHEDGFATFYQERSAFVTNRRFGADDLAAGLEHLRKWPGTYGYCDLRFFQTGGQINVVGKADTAFVHRDSRWLMVNGLYWGEADSHNEARMKANHDWLDAFYKTMRPRAGGGAYQNFADPGLSRDPSKPDYFATSYYGDNLPRLKAIKAAVDPDRVFKFAQAIPGA